MKNVSMFLLFLFVAVCSAARFPFEPQAPARRTLEHRAAEQRVLQALSRRDPCEDCEGFGPGCSCEAQKYCESEGCGTGECTTCTKKRTEMVDFLLKRKPNDCSDCAGFVAGCPCEAHVICKSKGCHNGECNHLNCAPASGALKHRAAEQRVLQALSRRDPCEDCEGFGPGCSCEAQKYCESEGCGTGACTACSKRKRTISDLLKRGDAICEDCPGFGPGCLCGDALLCTEKCGSAGECNSGNCSPTA
ncbi:uncharacterized protein LOC144660662 [Oculina patagonica]